MRTVRVEGRVIPVRRGVLPPLVRDYYKSKPRNLSLSVPTASRKAPQSRESLNTRQFDILEQ
jgi:hypothetical protein